MAASCGDKFDVWLGDKLTKICADVDLEVFVQYIRGILETDTDLEDKQESITDILGQITEEDLQLYCDEVIKKWDDNIVTNGGVKNEKGGQDAFEINIASAMEVQKSHTHKAREISAEERARKEAILAQYAQVSDGEGSDVEVDNGANHSHTGASKETATDLLTQNVNALTVGLRQQEERNLSKAEHEAKKTKDKEDREKQKQKEKDRKEAEKKRTQKGERRR